ncbi:Glycosyltransferase involved in cell wall bisynthesis [Pelosinus fermentans]|uniref:glycosyltransferase family 2 protein n=1 Tax=Pelosinus fermentans TaxID=365349 RepID=UPI0002685DA2|nr:glycosyltransferase family 2 protein [Pelosinus fermentans]OAM92795.1 glycosyl transferase family 2 [Pelosinus fermentans DSM 17108]SDQ57102.1 Glycosyltransferase involved in cell wall bisynthesis [Pelosinus fermentans]
MDKPLITIITVTYNAEETLERCIQSVLMQTYENVEFIIIDGLSTDGTVKVIEEYKDGISYWVSERDTGIYNAMNKGIIKAHGDIIYFLGADDYLQDKSVIETVMMQFINNSIIDVVFGRVILIKEGDKNSKIAGKMLTINDLRKGRMAPHQGMFIKAMLLKSLMFNEEYKISSDFELIIKCFINNYKVIFIDSVITCYSLDGLSGNNLYKMLTEQQKIIREHFGVADSLYFICKSAYILMRHWVKK